MSATAPSHGHPDKTSSKPQEEVKDSTASHPHSSKPDPTSTSSVQDAQGRLAASSTTSSAKLSSLQMRLKEGLRQYPDFPTKGVLFEDIMPIFADVKLHEALIDAFELHIMDTFGKQGKPDVIVGLDARGFLFGPSLALRLGAAFVPVRKTGKLPGETVTASFKKEYGEDFFQMQKGVIKEGQRVIIVDDIIATGGSAAAAGSLVKQMGGNLISYIFMMELDFLKGRDKLPEAPVFTIISGQEKS